jgi:Holliday junction resolvasome RuvABC endonuclease subunit
MGLDLATNCGWAVYDDVEKRWWSGSIDLSKGKRKDMDADTWRLVNMRNHLSLLAGNHPIIAVMAWEKVEFVKYRLAYDVHCQLTAVSKLAALDYRWMQKPVTVQDVKRAATGKGGNVSKENVLEAARLAWPDHEFADADEADARWVVVASNTELIKQYGANAV